MVTKKYNKILKNGLHFQKHHTNISQNYHWGEPRWEKGPHECAPLPELGDGVKGCIWGSREIHSGWSTRYKRGQGRGKASGGSQWQKED